MASSENSDDYWAAVKAAAGAECISYSDEELATYAEGRMRPRDAAMVKAHLDLCETCRGIVTALEAEVRTASDPPMVRVRPTPVRGFSWKWVWAPVAVGASVALLALALRGPHSPTVQPPVTPSDGGGVIAEGPPLAPDDSTPLTPPTPAPDETVVADVPPSAPDEALAPPVAHLRTGRTTRRPSRRAPEAEAPREKAVPRLPLGVPLQQMVADNPELVNEFPPQIAFSGEDHQRIFDVVVEIDPDEHPSLVNELPPPPLALNDEQFQKSIFQCPVNDLTVEPSPSSVSVEDLVP